MQIKQGIKRGKVDDRHIPYMRYIFTINKYGSLHLLIEMLLYKIMP